MCGVLKKPQQNTTFKGHQYSPKQVKQAQNLSTAYNQNVGMQAYKNVMNRHKQVVKIESQGGSRHDLPPKPVFKPKPIKETKYYHPAIKAWDDYDASVEAVQSASKKRTTQRASAPASRGSHHVLKTGSELDQGVVRKKRGNGKAVGRMTIR